MKTSFAFIALFVLSLSVSITSTAQLTIDIGAAKTENKANALTFGIQYVRVFDSSLQTKELFKTGKNSIVTFAPQFDVRFGSEDAFSAITGKMTALLTTYKKTTYEGLVVTDFKKTINAFPFSVGAESNSSFTTFNGILEAGYEPFYQSPLNNLPEVLKHTEFGLYLQAGHKFKGDSSSTALVGGAKDESAEKVNSNLLRVKGHFGIDTKSLVKGATSSVGLAGNANVWYDVVNKKVYHQIIATARIYLVNGAWLDLNYLKGSGAPNFNFGDEYRVGAKFRL